MGEMKFYRETLTSWKILTSLTLYLEPVKSSGCKTFRNTTGDVGRPPASNRMGGELVWLEIFHLQSMDFLQKGEGAFLPSPCADFADLITQARTNFKILRKVFWKQ